MARKKIDDSKPKVNLELPKQVTDSEKRALMDKPVQVATQPVINLDGIKIRLTTPDLDGDGRTGGTEVIPRRIADQGVSNIVQPTEIAESLRELNSDSLDPSTRMSGIDMRTRLHPAEISSVLAMDALVSLGILPTKCLAFTRQKKRLAVSLQGKGREDIVNVVSGKRELDQKLAGASLWDKAKGAMGGGQQ